MKLINRIFISAAAVLGIVGCVEEETPVSNAILADVNSLTFEAKDAEPQSFNIISEGVWTVDAPQWVSTDIASGGSGQTTITVSVSDNFIDGQMQLPRTDTLMLKGSDMYAHYYVIIKQLGDTYLGATEGTVSDAVALEVDKGFGLTESQVVAISDAGFVVTDGSANIFIATPAEVNVGDKVTLKGLRSKYNGMPALSSCENITVTSTAAAKHTQQKDLSSTLAAYKATTIEYVAVKGATLVASQIISTDGGKLVFLDAPESFNISKLNAHYVDLYGYYLADDEGGNGPFVVLTSIEDKGENENVKLPVKWVAASNDYPKWGSQSVIEPAEGFGLISYKFNEERRTEDGVNGAPASKLDVSGSNPRVNGVWPGDYWEFMSYVPAKAGQIIKLEFECRISQGGMRYWRMQYKDGSEWKDCRAVKTVTLEGESYEYTDDLYPGGSADDFNKVIVHGVRYENDTDAIAFRWTCVANYTGKDAVLTAPDSGSMRLDSSDANAVQPSISIGTEADIPNDNVANVEVKVEKSLTFEALPAAAKSFKVLSDNEIELTTDSKWIFFVGEDESQVSTLAIEPGVEAEVFVTCSENVDPETREGEIIIRSGATTETIKVIQVSPGVRLEPFISLVGGNSGNVTFEAGRLNLSVQSNVEFEYSTDAAWVTVQTPVETRALVDVKPIVINYEANTDSQERLAHISVYNKTENLETVYTLKQAGYVSGVFFQDDFNWVQPFVEADDQEKQGDSMLDNKQYTPGTSYNIEGFESKLTELGYEALFPSSKAIYVMKGNYLKFSKGQNTNGIRLPKMNFNGETTVALSFDWGINVGSGGPDAVELEVVVEGSGSISGSDKSAPLKHTSGDWEWQTESVIITGVDATTRISIRPTTFTGEVDATKTYYRWFLDNVKVEKGNPMDAESCTLAVFPFPNDPAFTGEGDGAGTKWNLSEGWLLSEDGKSKMSSHVADGSGLKVTYKYEARKDTEVEGIKDHVRVLATGMPVGGYWLFEVPVKDAPAGTYNITYKHSASATGPNYFLMEVSVDGNNWLPVESQTTSETFADGTSARNVTWTYALNRGGSNAANVAYVVDVDYSAPAIVGNSTLYIRAKIADDMAYGAAKAMGTNGTNRIWGPCEVTFKKN